MAKNKIGWGFKLNPNLEEAFNYAKQEFQIENLPGAMFWFTDENGETKLWKGLLPIPYQVNYKLNEEVDIASIKLITLRDSDFVMEHKIPNMAKCKLLHEVYSTIESKEDLLTFDEYGRPTNHDDYYIAGGMCKFTGSDSGPSNDVNKLGRYEHNYDLVEPIYVTRYVMCENRTFTNMTSIIVTDAATGEATTYNQEPTNLLYVLENILKTAGGVKTSKEDTTWFSKIKIMDKELLKNNGVGCSINFNTASLYDNLFKIGKYIKRLPVLYFNPNFDPSEDAENEDSREFLLFFEHYDGSDKEEITWDEFRENSTGYMESQNGNKDAGTMISEAQNVEISDPIWYPGYGLWMRLTGDESEIVLSNTNELNLKLPYNIREIFKLKCLIHIYGDSATNHGTSLDEIIEIPCLEKKEWILLNSQEREKYAYYEKGKNIIYNLFENSFKQWQEYTNPNAVYPNGVNKLNLAYVKFTAYSVFYKPLINAKVVQSVSNSLQNNISQLDSSVNSDLWGSYLENYAEGNSAIDITNGKIFYKYSDIWMPGTRIIKDDEEYIISSTTFQRFNGFYKASFEANKNVIKRSNIVTTDNRCDNKIIESDKSQLRLSNIKEKPIKIELGTSRNLNAPQLKYINNYKYLYNGLCNRNYLDDKIICKFDYKDATSKYFMLPILRTTFGNSITFTINANNNMFLATRSIGNSNTNDSKPAQQTPIKYTDPFGRVKAISTKLQDYQENITNSINDNLTVVYEDNIEARLRRENTIAFVDKFLSASKKDYDNASSYIQVQNYEYYKQTNEIMNVSVQFDFKPKDKNTFFTKGLLNQFLITPRDERVQFYLLSINSSFKIMPGDTISPSKCYHPKCKIQPLDLNRSFDILVDTENSNGEELWFKKGWQIALGVLRDDGNFDILIATKIDLFSEELTKLYSVYFNFYEGD